MITKQRENMPDIGAGAHKTLSERSDYNRQHFNKEKKEISIATCKTCDKEYNQAEADKVLADLPSIENFDYDNQCLKCIKEVSQEINSLRQPELIKSKQKLANITIVFQEITKKYKLLAKEHQELDYQANMINLHLLKPVKKPKTSTPRKKTDAQIKKATALKILGNLTADQQEALLAIINKQK